jgi:hypothetical protein
MGRQNCSCREVKWGIHKPHRSRSLSVLKGDRVALVAMSHALSFYIFCLFFFESPADQSNHAVILTKLSTALKYDAVKKFPHPLAISRRAPGFQQNNTRKTVVLFLHVHKCAGSFFISLVNGLPNQHVPENNGLLMCPPLSQRSSLVKQVCGYSHDALLPFWKWSTSLQAKCFQSISYTFISNERWLGQELLQMPSTPSPTANSLDFLQFSHVIIVRHPLDRIASHFHYAKGYSESRLHGRNLSFASFVRAGPCREPDAGFRCWDANHYVQVSDSGVLIKIPLLLSLLSHIVN